METLKFDCGCEFEIIKDEKNPAGLPCLNIDYEQILYDLNYGKYCPKVWEILGEGKTKGVFQLESYLGQNWCIKLKPTCIDDMAALAALIRPSCLDSVVDGKNLAQHYVDRKHNVEPAKPIHPALEDLLASTQQIILFQEDSIRIAVDVAGFTEEEADLLRKAIGEKKPDLMAKAKAMFIEGCKKVNKVTEEEALNIFNIIEASQRYCVTGDTLFRRVGEPPISVANLYLEKDRSQYSLSLCADGRIRRNKVFDVIYEGKQEVLKIELENGYSCKVTPSHRFPLSYEEEIEAKDLKVGDYLLCGSTGKYPIYQSTITKITPLEKEDVYTISMYPPNHTYLINEGIITSNCFNKAHATSYGMLGYLTEYIKYHCPITFFSSYIALADEKIDPHEEIKQLINEAKMWGIQVLLPNLKTIFKNNCDVCIDGEVIRFGLRSMKGLGDSSIQKIREVVEESNLGPIHEWTWIQILYYLLPAINSQCAHSLICGGVFDLFGITRSRMLLEYQKIKELTKKQIEILKEENLPIIEGLSKVEERVNKNQKIKINDLKKLLISSTHSTTDHPLWIMRQEKDIYGVSVTYNPTDVLKQGSNADTTCEEFLDGKDGECRLVGEIEEARKFKVKNGPNKGKMMVGFKLNDGSATIDCVVFSKNFSLFSKFIEKGNFVQVQGKRSDSNSLMVDNLQEIF